MIKQRARPKSADPATATEVPAGIPMMVTQAMKARLVKAGWNVDEIVRMRPVQAWEKIVEANKLERRRLHVLRGLHFRSALPPIEVFGPPPHNYPRPKDDPTTKTKLLSRPLPRFSPASLPLHLQGWEAWNESPHRPPWMQACGEIKEPALCLEWKDGIPYGDRWYKTSKIVDWFGEYALARRVAFHVDGSPVEARELGEPTWENALRFLYWTDIYCVDPAAELRSDEGLKRATKPQIRTAMRAVNKEAIESGSGGDRT